MLDTQEIMIEIGVIMLVAFIGAALASRFKQSVIVGYILVGIFIGPNIGFELFGFQYSGFIDDISFVEYMAQIGLTMLMFFVGLQFSVSKLKRTKGPSLILALVDTGLNMFLGIMLGMALGWPLVDSLFLAGVVAISSSAITGKSLMELNKFSSPETEFLLGMVVMESFIGMVLLTIIGGLAVKTTGAGIGADSFLNMVFGFVAFLAFFAFLAVVVIPRSAKYLQHIKSEELFVLFGLGLVFLSSALAQASGVPAIIGAFFLGMVFAETKLAERFDSKLTSFRDVFVAIFFVFFGMLIDPAMFASVIGLVLLAVPLAIIGEQLLLSGFAYLLGFSSRAASSMGASMCGRGAESIMYASIGSSAPAITRGAEINPFAGLFCFIMSTLTPILMRASDQTSRAISKVLPSYVKKGGAIMSRTMGKVLLPSSLRLFRRGRTIEYALVAYFVALIAVAATTGIYHVIAFLAALGLTIWTLNMFESELSPIVRSINYDNLGANLRGSQQISRYISMFISASLLAILLVAFVFQYLWWGCLVVMVGYLLGLLLLMRHYSYAVQVPASLATNRFALSPPKFNLPTPRLARLKSDEKATSPLHFPLPAVREKPKPREEEVPTASLGEKEDRYRYL